MAQRFFYFYIFALVAWAFDRFFMGNLDLGIGVHLLMIWFAFVAAWVTRPPHERRG